MLIETINLQEGVSNATLMAYLQNPYINLTNEIVRPAILIIPGGAYISHTDKEAEPVAIRFLSAGYQVFVLKYSIGIGMALFPSPILDVARSILLIRKNAKNWGIDSDQITLCGFSTGGHLAATYATGWQDAEYANLLKTDNIRLKPNAVILGYPLIDLYRFQVKHSNGLSSMQPILEMMFSSIFGTLQPKKEQLDEYNVVKKVTKQMPPTFLWTTSEETIVDVEDSLNFIKVLAQYHIPYEYHIFQEGAHGLSLGDKTVGYTDEEIKLHENVSKWIDLALVWIDHLKQKIVKERT